MYFIIFELEEGWLCICCDNDDDDAIIYKLKRFLFF